MSRHRGRKKKLGDIKGGKRREETRESRDGYCNGCLSVLSRSRGLGEVTLGRPCQPCPTPRARDGRREAEKSWGREICGGGEEGARGRRGKYVSRLPSAPRSPRSLQLLLPLSSHTPSFSAIIGFSEAYCVHSRSPARKMDVDNIVCHFARPFARLETGTPGVKQGGGREGNRAGSR